MLTEKCNATKMIFRSINNDLELLENGTERQKSDTIKRLIIINEELSDYVYDMVVALNKI